MKKWSEKWLIKQCKKLGLTYGYVEIGEKKNNNMVKVVRKGDKTF